jgi:F-type H+-transporting ATPase subunit b
MRPPRRWLFPALLAFLLIASVAGPALAGEAGEHDPADAPIGTLFRWLNFALVFGGLGYWIAKNAPAFFRARAEHISAAMTEAAAAKAEAERHLREAEEKLARLDQEVAWSRAAARRESAAEAERLRATTLEEVGKIARAARAEVEAAVRAARVELKALAAQAAVERADVLLRKQITAQTQAALFRLFLDDLSRSAN